MNVFLAIIFIATVIQEPSFYGQALPTPVDGKHEVEPNSNSVSDEPRNNHTTDYEQFVERLMRGDFSRTTGIPNFKHFTSELSQPSFINKFMNLSDIQKNNIIVSLERIISNCGSDHPLTMIISHILRQVKNGKEMQNVSSDDNNNENDDEEQLEVRGLKELLSGTVDVLPEQKVTSPNELQNRSPVSKIGSAAMLHRGSSNSPNIKMSNEKQRSTMTI